MRLQDQKPRVMQPRSCGAKSRERVTTMEYGYRGPSIDHGLLMSSVEACASGAGGSSVVGALPVPSKDHANSMLLDTKHRSYLSVRVSHAAHGDDVPCLLACNLRERPSASTLSHTVLRVFLSRSKLKMCWVTAGLVVTDVHHDETWRYGSISDLEGYSVRKTPAVLPVAIPEQRTCERPAFALRSGRYGSKEESGIMFPRHVEPHSFGVSGAVAGVGACGGAVILSDRVQALKLARGEASRTALKERSNEE